MSGLIEESSNSVKSHVCLQTWKASYALLFLVNGLDQSLIFRTNNKKNRKENVNSTPP